MNRTSLETFAQAVSADWGSLSSELVLAMRGHIERLLQAPPAEAWLADLQRDMPPSRELVRDPQHGFVLLAHAEAEGLYRPPHDHGRSWVIYAVLAGASEMGTYGRIKAVDGTTHLVKRGSTIVRPGQVQVYLPGDVHDTRCVSGPALLYRFTERDLKVEDSVYHRVNRFTLRDGVWVAP